MQKATLKLKLERETISDSLDEAELKMPGLPGTETPVMPEI